MGLYFTPIVGTMAGSSRGKHGHRTDTDVDPEGQLLGLSVYYVSQVGSLVCPGLGHSWDTGPSVIKPRQSWENWHGWLPCP